MTFGTSAPVTYSRAKML